ncbi:MAG TPA: hypothetical protein VIW23_00375 [Candidatus Acidoferrum sp.]|jgi:hypothetical protein
MPGAKNIERIEGTLTEKGGRVWHIELRVTIAVLEGPHGVECEEVARLELDSSVPDGEYILDYFCLKHRTRSVRVKLGAFVAA